MVNFLTKVLNPFWWFDLLVIKPLMLLLSALFWLPLWGCKKVWTMGMSAWNSKWMNYLKPKSLWGKMIVYPPLIWCALPFTNTWLFGYIAYKYGVTWDDVWGITSGVWSVTKAMCAAAWDLIPMGWAALQYVL
jgi:hypothetical protein